MKLEGATINLATLITVVGLAGSAAVAYSQNNERLVRIEAEKVSLREANDRQDKELRELRGDIKDSLREIKQEIASINSQLRRGNK